MRIIAVDVLSCAGGNRILNFVRIRTDQGLTGCAECNCKWSAPVIRAAVEYLGGLVIGRDPFHTERIQHDLCAATKRQFGGVVHMAISGIDAALLDIKGKALGGPDCAIALDVAFVYKMVGIRKLAKALEPFNILWLEAETLDPEALRSVRESTSTPICIGESFYRTQGFKPYLEAHALDMVMPDTVWNGITVGKKVADYANTYDILFAPHNSHGALGTWQAAHLCATVENFRILEYEHDDVPWRDEIVTEPTVIDDGHLELSGRPGLGCDIVEEAIAAHAVDGCWRKD